MRPIRLVARRLLDLLASVFYGPDLPGGINEEMLPFAYHPQAPHRRGGRQVRSLWHVQF
jgi:hypothetical protein